MDEVQQMGVEEIKVAERGLFEANHHQPSVAKDVADGVLEKKRAFEEENRKISERALKIAEYEQLKGQFSSRGTAFQGVFDAYDTIKSADISRFFSDYDKIEANLLKVALAEEKDERVTGENPRNLKEYQRFKAFFEKADADFEKATREKKLETLAPDTSKMNDVERAIYNFNDFREKSKKQIKEQRRAQNASFK